MQTITIADMSCAHCVATVEKAIRTADPEAQFTVDLAGGRADVESHKIEAVIAAIGEAGYPAAPANS